MVKTLFFLKKYYKVILIIGFVVSFIIGSLYSVWRVYIHLETTFKEHCESKITEQEARLKLIHQNQLVEMSNNFGKSIEAMNQIKLAEQIKLQESNKKLSNNYNSLMRELRTLKEEQDDIKEFLNIRIPTPIYNRLLDLSTQE